MTTRRKLALGIGVIAILGVFAILYPFASYFVADYQYEKLVKTSAATKTEVERVLFLYSVEQIDIKKSAWGNSHSLAAGEMCYQYRILGREPIDIVYDSGWRVKEIFASYE
jgi:hypothetical protein